MIRVERLIAAPAAVVWDLLVDTQAWPSWGPSVRQVRCATRYIASGSRGQVVTPLGVALPFVVTDFVPGAFWAWRVLGVPATGHRVEPLGAQRCRLVFEIPTLAAPYAVVCQRAASALERLSSQTP